MLADEDKEQDPDRWCSRTACGQEFCQILHQWIWNLRLDFGHRLSPSAMRLTQFAPAEPAACVHVLEPAEPSAPVPAQEEVVYGPPQWAHRSFTKEFAGSDFVLQPDGILRCPADHPLTLQERRPERNGSVRLVYGARARHCRPCPLRAQCQESATTIKPQQVSAVVWPISSDASASTAPPPLSIEAPSILLEPLPPPLEPALFPVLWGDWLRCSIRRRWFQLLRSQTVLLSPETVQLEKQQVRKPSDRQTRAQRAHWRLSWNERLACNARLSTAPLLEVTIHGLPAMFANIFGFGLVHVA